MGLTRLIPRPALVRFQMAVLSLRAPVAVLAFAWAVYQVWIGVTAPLSVPDSHWGDHTRAWPPEGYQYETRQISGDLEMKLVAGGPKNGSKGLVLLLHGFPLTSAQWSGYLEHFVSDGYRTLAPDLRLVNDSLPQDSQTPPTWDQLVADIENLIATEGPAAAHGAILVTHDWGVRDAPPPSLPPSPRSILRAVVCAREVYEQVHPQAALGWAFALRRPDLTRSFVTMNIPHLVLYRKRAISMLRWTWYVMYQGLTRHFALWRAKKDDFAWVEWFWLATSRSGVFGRPEIEALKDVWRKGSLGTFMLWYRHRARTLQHIADLTLGCPAGTQWLRIGS